MPSCDGCGAHVSRDYHRVFSDGDGEVRACPSCENTSISREYS